MTNKVKPNAPGYWGAELQSGKFKIFEAADINGKIKLLHKNWRTTDQIEESFNIKKWLGKIVPENLGKG